MSWIRHILFDLLVTVFIVAAVVMQVDALRWIALAYTGLMVALKGLALVMGGLLNLAKPRENAPPAWIFHVFYATCTIAPLAVGWWWMAGGWALIWVFSVIAERRTPSMAGQ